MKSLFMLAAVAGLAGCTTAATSPPVAAISYMPTTLTAEQTEAVKAGVRKGLKDPNSALFDGSFMASLDPSNQMWVCGYVNARNSFGGYTGGKPFIGGFAGTEFQVAGFGGDDIETSVVLGMCRQHSINLSPS